MLRRAAPVIGIAAVAIVGAWLLFYWLPRWRSQPAAPAAPAGTQGPAVPGRKITATLYYISEDGMSLVGVQREVPFGEPVAEESDLFGTAVQLARRVCDEASGGEILVSDVVRQLAAGKEFLFSDRGVAALKGFDEPVRLFEVRWREG